MQRRAALRTCELAKRRRAGHAPSHTNGGVRDSDRHCLCSACALALIGLAALIARRTGGRYGGIRIKWHTNTRRNSRDTTQDKEKAGFARPDKQPGREAAARMSVSLEYRRQPANGSARACPAKLQLGRLHLALSFASLNVAHWNLRPRRISVFSLCAPSFAFARYLLVSKRKDQNCPGRAWLGTAAHRPSFPVSQPKQGDLAPAPRPVIQPVFPTAGLPRHSVFLDLPQSRKPAVSAHVPALGLGNLGKLSRGFLFPFCFFACCSLVAAKMPPSQGMRAINLIYRKSSKKSNTAY